MSLDGELSVEKVRIYHTSVLPRNFDLLRVGVVIPVMEERFKQNFLTYKIWKNGGFDVELVATEGDKERIEAFLRAQVPNMEKFFKIRTYNPRVRANAGIAKKSAYNIIVESYLDNSIFMYAVLLDDTVNDIIDTKSSDSMLTSPSKFCKAVERFAAVSPVFGGTVAAKRHLGRWNDQEVAVPDKLPVAIKGAFIQQAVVFSCRGAPTLRNHFENIDDYVRKMSELTYREVPFGEDVSFQLALTEHGVLKEGKSAQFRGFGVSRMRHKSATKRPFNKLDDASKKALKDMMFYLRHQKALKFNYRTKLHVLTGVAVIPGGPIRIRIKGKHGERPWMKAYNYAFPQIRRKTTHL